MEEDTIPVFTSLSDVYEEGPQLEVAKARYNKLKHKFVELYGQEPQIFARAPGRVNLIGEHIDYEGYSVLPMAIRQDTVVAIGRSNNTQENPPMLHIANIDSEEFKTCSFQADPAQVFGHKKEANNLLYIAELHHILLHQIPFPVITNITRRLGLFLIRSLVFSELGFFYRK
jgi:hypothetical protein